MAQKRITLNRRLQLISLLVLMVLIGFALLPRTPQKTDTPQTNSTDLPNITSKNDLPKAESVLDNTNIYDNSAANELENKATY